VGKLCGLDVGGRDVPCGRRRCMQWRTTWRWWKGWADAHGRLWRLLLVRARLAGAAVVVGVLHP